MLILFSITQASNLDDFKDASYDLWTATKGIASDLKDEYLPDDKNETDSNNTLSSIDNNASTTMDKVILPFKDFSKYLEKKIEDLNK